MRGVAQRTPYNARSAGLGREGNRMKKFALAATLAVSASTAFAGGVAEPVMEPEVVAAATSSSAGGIVVPLLLLLLLAAALSGGQSQG